MRNKLYLFVGVTATIFMFSCSNSGLENTKSTGGTSELLVITETPEQWQGVLGDSIRTIFGSEFEALPQSEPKYDLINASVKKFENNPLYASQSMMLVTKYDTSKGKSPIEVARNKWASPQIIITLVGANDSALVAVLAKYKDAVMELFHKNQLERTQSLYQLSRNRDAESKLNEQFNIDILIPGSFSLATKTNDIIWLRQSIHRKKQDTDLGLVFYSQPYKDTAQFGLNKIIEMRNLFGSKYIKGPTENSFMSTSTEVIPPQIQPSENKETGYRVITRGLWIIKKDFMGGPFISYTLYNKKTNTILTAEGYVYNPNGEKRNFIIQLEAILQSIRFVEDQKNEN